ncbi:unnamed protein product [Lactuca virosa]|uniref:Uncharacterized protein n=1 Tax=Lactuca virosa TaxID=75947 RepID=A0AAU9P3M4_9ASTR|nr:unnamed protein product [Lactuca virosa]
MPSSEEVISILDDNTHRSEGLQGDSKQPIMNKDSIGDGLTGPPSVHRSKSPTALETYDYDDLIASFQGNNLSFNNVFIPKWNLTDESRLSQQEVVVEFLRHVFPKGTVSEMEAFTDD